MAKKTLTIDNPGVVIASNVPGKLVLDFNEFGEGGVVTKRARIRFTTWDIRVLAEQLARGLKAQRRWLDEIDLAFKTTP